jgi:hypothetical protein
MPLAEVLKTHLKNELKVDHGYKTAFLPLRA